MALRGESAVFDSWKKCKANLSDALAKKLTPAQREVRLRPPALSDQRLAAVHRPLHRPQAFLTNAALLSVAMSKPDQGKEVLATLAAEFPKSQVSSGETTSIGTVRPPLTRHVTFVYPSLFTPAGNQSHA